MPTREVLASFWRDWDRLGPKQQREFRAAVAQFIADLAGGDQAFHPRLRVKRVQGHPGVWEMTWAYDGRATFEYGAEVNPGEPHVIWRRAMKRSARTSPDEIQHFLVVLDPAMGETNVEEFGTDYDAALAAYAEAEKVNGGVNPRLDIVLLSADSLETIERTHSSYFGADSKELEELLPR